MSYQPSLSLEEQAQSTWNRLWFGWRQFRKATRSHYREQAESKASLFGDSLELALREQNFRDRYALHQTHQRTSQKRYLEILTHLEFLEQLLPEGLSQAETSWLDIGAKNWSYVDALYRFLNRHGEGSLTGIEIDAYRLYPDWHSRMDYARHYATPFENAQYLSGDLMAHHARYNVISWFLPFVFLSPCLSWGLPANCFKPLDQLRHAFSLLEPDGTLLIVNQGQVEFDEQGSLLAQLQAEQPNLNIEWSGPLETSFMDYRYPRYGYRCRKQA